MKTPNMLCFLVNKIKPYSPDVLFGAVRFISVRQRGAYPLLAQVTHADVEFAKRLLVKNNATRGFCSLAIFMKKSLIRIMAKTASFKKRSR
jgi:hypothetical protein